MVRINRPVNLHSR